MARAAPVAHLDRRTRQRRPGLVCQATIDRKDHPWTRPHAHLAPCRPPAPRASRRNVEPHHAWPRRGVRGLVRTSRATEREKNRAWMLQAPQYFDLDLLDSLTRQPELLSHPLQCMLFVFADAEAQPHDRLFSRRERLQSPS